jgi:capsular exopolysaccharide synthesis family protein
MVPASTLADGIGQMRVLGTDAAVQPAFDFWGLLQRRKYLIALFCLIGAGLGYLNYVKSPKTYSSNIRMLISTQAPPSIVNGNILLNQNNSLPNHTSLLISELVLSSAVEEGNLDRLNTFSMTGNPVGLLKNMIRVVPEKGDTFRITCAGTEPEELPGILNQVVESYRRIIVDDSQTVSEKTVELIEKLAGKLSDEKDDLVDNRMKLWRELDISSIDESGGVINPHSRKLVELRSYKDETELSLADIRLRSSELISSLKADGESDVVNPLQIKVAAMEAKEFLKVNGTSLAGAKSASTKAAEGSERQWQALQQRAWDIESSIVDLRAQLVDRSAVVGSGHGDILSLKKRIKFRQRELSKVATEMETVQNSSLAAQEDESLTTQQAALSKVLEEEDKNWIRMYLLALQKQEKTLSAKLEQVDESIKTVSGRATDVGEKIVQLNVIQKTIEKKEQAVDVILDRLKEMNVLADNYTMTKIRVLDEPKQGYQIAPSFAKCLATGAMLACLCGIGLAYLIDKSELSFRSPTEILSHLQIPVVGKIPRIRTRGLKVAKGNAELITAHKPSASESEAFRDVRTGLFFRSANEDIKTILFTSPSPGDGKSTTAANLAISIAQAGKQVVLVDADFRRPRVDRYFGEKLECGMVDVMSGEVEIADAIKPTELQPGLSLITAGGHPKNPGELVTSEIFRETIAALREQFDYVIIDSPPILPVSDSVTIASMVDGVYLVTRIRKGVKLTAKKAKDSLDTVQASWMGLIVNDVDQNPYYNEYGYQYGSYAYYGSKSYKTYYEDRRTPQGRSRIGSGSSS